MTEPPITPAERDQLAAEYALGVLDGEALRRARSLAASDPEFGDQVARWSGRLAPLLDDVQPVSPPARLWSNIDRHLGGLATPSSNVVVLHRRVNLWRGIAAGATALAASLAIVLVSQPQLAVAPANAPAAAPLVAMIGDDHKQMKLVASWDPAGRQLVLAVAGDMPGDARHSHELWVIPNGGKPLSLGTMPDKRRMHMQLAEALATLMQDGATIAVSVEPAGGSPTGSPTGPVVASGTLDTA